jgi:hypothetical protein
VIFAVLLLVNFPGPPVLLSLFAIVKVLNI